MQSKRQGFTLIELLVVIAIIGILAGMVLVSMSGARAKARDAKRQSDLRQMISAQEMYAGDNSAGAYVENTGTAMPTAIGAYLSPVPNDPVNTTGAACPPLADTYKYCALDNDTVDGVNFCYYARLEQAIDSKDFFVASDAASGLRTAAPTTFATCVPD
jgi:prepilin-type N-terminal cleavage/methylation domain-containing protein